MRYVVASVGALLVFVLLCAIGAVPVVGLMWAEESSGIAVDLAALFVLLVAAFAARSSFRATLARYESNTQPEGNNPKIER